MYGGNSGDIFPLSKQLEDDEEQEWDEVISNKTFIESGFGLINQLMMTVVECFFRELRDTEEQKKPQVEPEPGQEVADDQLVLAVIKYFEEGEQQHWPELIRIIMKSKRFSFTPLSHPL